MPRRAEPETPSLKWIHRISAQQYRKTKELPVEAWLHPVDVEKVAQSLRRLGLKVRLPPKKAEWHVRRRRATPYKKS